MAGSPKRFTFAPATLPGAISLPQGPRCKGFRVEARPGDRVASPGGPGPPASGGTSGGSGVRSRGRERPHRTPPTRPAPRGRLVPGDLPGGPDATGNGPERLHGDPLPPRGRGALASPPDRFGRAVAFLPGRSTAHRRARHRRGGHRSRALGGVAAGADSCPV